ncbi:MAG TPA: ferredoxin [Methanoregulaceae archaeon]|nr:MAG: ferredoxin [Methanolinea sp.]HON81959.1 ferredoxin [Methanoregulaceae archaeon]HPD10715.1 ferredoxin [Methanoregulaceae archaeon]HRT15844.1 ferredoxin [Methanoregulaceae archaeon]HRU31601.1 ferredoxin [Methanoregulaceae archaeon]
MNARIIRDECISCGTCVDICPEFFELGKKDGLSQVVEQHRTGGKLDEGSVPPGLEEAVKDAADLCPVQVILIE